MLECNRLEQNSQAWLFYLEVVRIQLLVRKASGKDNLGHSLLKVQAKLMKMEILYLMIPLKIFMNCTLKFWEKDVHPSLKLVL